jgi:broad specificity phosphatase PhoE
MPIFLLIRHGETDYNKKMLLPGRLPGVHLNKKGQHQARLLAEALNAAPIHAIFYLGLPLDNYQRLTINTGSVTVMQITEDGSRLILLNHDPSFTWDSFQVLFQNKPSPSTKAKSSSQ